EPARRVARCQVPQEDGSPGGAGGQGLAVGRKGDGEEELAGRLQLVQLHLPGGGVPDVDHVVQPRGGDHLAVGGEGDGVAAAVLAVGLEELFARRRVPQAGGVVHVSRDELLAVLGEADGGDGRAVPQPYGPQAGRGTFRQGIGRSLRRRCVGRL